MSKFFSPLNPFVLVIDLLFQFVIMIFFTAFALIGIGCYTIYTHTLGRLVDKFIEDKISEKNI